MKRRRLEEPGTGQPRSLRGARWRGDVSDWHRRILTGLSQRPLLAQVNGKQGRGKEGRNPTSLLGFLPAQVGAVCGVWDFSLCPRVGGSDLQRGGNDWGEPVVFPMGQGQGGDRRGLPGRGERDSVPVPPGPAGRRELPGAKGESPGAVCRAATAPACRGDRLLQRRPVTGASCKAKFAGHGCFVLLIYFYFG